MNSRHYAHTREGAPPDQWQPLIEHLENVARLAATHAAEFNSEPWGKLAGWWHDLGKYCEDFRSYLLSFAGDDSIVDASVLDAPANGPSQGRRVDHSTVGAVLVYEKCRDRLTRDGRLPAIAASLAMALAGHHGGLPARSTFEMERLIDPSKRARLAAALSGAPAGLTGHALPEPPAFLRPEAFVSGSGKDDKALRYELWTRMLLSALVDADRLDTEQFMDPRRAAVRARTWPPQHLLSRMRDQLTTYLDSLIGRSRERLSALPDLVRPQAEAVLELRKQVLIACRTKADGSPGCYSLTVPTGGGKTLAALAFALQHSLRHGLRRVIVVIPFTSIIDQTARVYREALGRLGRAVVEHHSNLDPARESVTNRLASENWDAPVIVTTSVQFFESLFACRPSAVRKLHNIARSVVVFDEVQTLPHHLRTPIFEVLNQLVDHYGVTALCCTATQPALEKNRSGRDPFPSLRGVTEVIDDVPAAFAIVHDRVRAEFPAEPPASTTWEALAAEVKAHERVLVIVHRRDDARDLCRRLPETTFHLSALMCAAHRKEVLARIGQNLEVGGFCRVVSTTLIEAGVDVDFPVVYRALGGVDAMAQAAGRCNREGRLADQDGRPIPGRLILFRAPSDPPEGLALGLETTERLLAVRNTIDLFSPETYRRYFGAYLDNLETDRFLVTPARVERDFPEVERRFRMIENDGQAPIVVPFGDAGRRIEDYSRGPSRRTLRALQPFIVNASERAVTLLTRAGLIETLHDQVRWLIPDGGRQYDERFGLVTDHIVPRAPADLIVDDECS